MNSFHDCLGFGLICWHRPVKKNVVAFGRYGCVKIRSNMVMELVFSIDSIFSDQNKIKYGDGAGSFNRINIFRWTSFLSDNIRFPPRNDSLSKSIFEALHISVTFPSVNRLVWSPRKPFPQRNSCNISILVEETSSLIGAIIRGSTGVFIADLHI